MDLKDNDMCNKNVWVKLYGENSTVTTSYLKAIGAAYQTLGKTVRYFTDVDTPEMSRLDTIVIATAMDCYRLHLKGFKQIVFWSQGVWPEESFARHEGRLRLALCNHIEKQALVWADKLFLVSRAMLRHYEMKYSLELETKSFVMACSNEEIHPEAFMVKEKYSHPVFAYAGSLVSYQCIDQMLEAYADAKAHFPESRFLFFTNEVEEAKHRVDALGLKDVVIDNKPQNQLWKYIADAKYGFVLREDTTVNRVATPTKISTYLASGVIPIYGSCIEAFSETSKHIYKLEYNKDTFIADLTAIEAEDINASDIFKQYKDYFAANLSLSSRADDITEFLKKAV